MQEYNDDSIVSMSSHDHMRYTPSAYIGSNGLEGHYWLFKEIIENSVDEINHRHKVTGVLDGVINTLLFVDRETNQYQVVVLDNGRGVPHDSVINVFTSEHTGGKFNQDAYGTSSGVNGRGSKVVFALSNDFRAISIRNNEYSDTTNMNYKNLPKSEVKGSVDHPDGQLIVYSPDDTVLFEAEGFLGSQDFINDLSIKIAFFSKGQTTVGVINKPLTKKELNLPAPKFLMLIKRLIKRHKTLDSREIDMDKYLTSIFQPPKRLVEFIEFDIIDDNSGSRLKRMQGKLWFTDTQAVNNNLMAAINNITINNKTSLHYTLMTAFIKDELADLLPKDNDLAVYFNNVYRLPIWYFLNISYAGAKFSGMEKKGFSDTTFTIPYKKVLAKIFTKDVLNDLYSKLKENIENSFESYTKRNLRLQNRSVITEINNLDHYNPCISDVPEECELIIVEGESASNLKYKGDHQAILGIKGKTLNAIAKAKSETEVGKILERDHVYSDVITILGIKNRSIKNLKFHKIFITTDGDVHGYHIANLLIGNLFAYLPELVTNGHIHVVLSPMYKLSIKKSKRNLYARNDKELTFAFAEHIYYNYLSIRLRASAEGKIFLDEKMDKNDFINFSYLITVIGERVCKMADTLCIDPVMLEQLALMSHLVDFNNPDTKVMSAILQNPVSYRAETNVLIISVGFEDIVIPLVGLTEIIYSSIRPMYRTLMFGDIVPVVTTTNGNIQDRVLSPVQLYQWFVTLQGFFDIKPLKGLGNIGDEDGHDICLREETRRSTQVTSVGDAKMIFDIMNDDSSFRKKLIEPKQFC